MRNTITSVVIVLAFYAPVGAQTTSEQLLLERTAAVQGEVIVRDDRGRNIAGRLIGISDEELELETRGGRRWLDLSRVVRVTEPGDPIIDGVFRGMGVATALCVLTCERTDENIRGTAFVSRVAIGGVIGGLFDRAVNGNRTIYQRRPTPTIHIGVGPRGGNVTVVF